MRLESVTLSGFRCFGNDPITVTLSAEITAVIGPNASGKTALLQALTKLFGINRAQRTINRSDFHVAADADPDDRNPKELVIDVLVAFPELADGTATPESVAPTFRHIVIAREKRPPVCRFRLEARWENDGTVEGEVSQEICWVDTLDETPEENDKHPVSAADRGLIQLYYTPANRDAGAQVRATAGALAARLLRAIEWSDEVRDSVDAATEELVGVFEGEAAIKAIGKRLEKRWSLLHDEQLDTKPRLSLVSRRFEEVVSKIAVIFEQGPDGYERGLDALSDGQQSLFYFALVAAVFDMERQVVKGKVDGFHTDQIRIPALSIFALEEPENHLSPFFLARILGQVRSLTEEGSAQVLVTSHSPAVLSRVKPMEVRYCRCDPKTRVSSLKRIKLPSRVSEAGKFVRSAMLAFPELYFARFVLLVEGDSERVVLPKLAKALDLLVDPAFIAIVPLGGRHVQHFWRLLSHLDIPYATLLDLDLGRAGAGFGRIKTVIKNLIDIGVPKAKLLKIDNGVLSDAEFAEMHTWQDPEGSEYLRAWIDCLKEFGVFFSEPLDLDLSMISAFPEAYAATIPKGGGPRMTAAKAAEAVLGSSGPGLTVYTGPYKGYPPVFSAYRYHFLTHSKPATHLAALAHINSRHLKTGMPPVLAEVLAHITKSLKSN